MLMATDKFFSESCFGRTRQTRSDKPTTYNKDQQGLIFTLPGAWPMSSRFNPRQVLLHLSPVPVEMMHNFFFHVHAIHATKRTFKLPPGTQSELHQVARPLFGFTTLPTPGTFMGVSCSCAEEPRVVAQAL